jgi:hypothetical protein
MDRDDDLRKDTNYSPGSDTDTERLQNQQSPALHDDEIDEAAVKTLPGTGGPDDEGQIEIDPEDLDLKPTRKT